MPSSPDRFPSYLPAQRVGAPTVSIYPAEFAVRDVYDVDFTQPLKVTPVTNRWVQLATSLIDEISEHRVRLVVGERGQASVVGRFQESALEYIVQGIDSALETADQHYYPQRYRLDKAEWEQWHAKRADIRARAEELKAVQTQYLGTERRGD